MRAKQIKKLHNSIIKFIFYLIGNNTHYMKINHQEFKITNKTTKQSTPTTKNKHIKPNSISPCNCDCGHHIINLSQEIYRMNRQISIIFQLIQVSDKISKQGAYQMPLKQSNQMNQIKVQEESLLLDGLDSQNTLDQQKEQLNKKSQNFSIGKQVVLIKQKLKQMQQQSQQISKMKKNFSLLTKIVEQISSKIQSSQAIKFLASTQSVKDKSSSNCSLIQEDKKTADATKKSQKNKQKISSYHLLIPYTPLQIKSIENKHQREDCKMISSIKKSDKK